MFCVSLMLLPLVATRHAATMNKKVNHKHGGASRQVNATHLTPGAGQRRHGSGQTAMTTTMAGRASGTWKEVVVWARESWVVAGG